MSDHSFYSRAEITCGVMEERFHVPGTTYYYERVKRLPTDRKVSELWPYSGVVSAYNALAAHPKFGEKYHAPLRRVLEGLEAYFDANAYDSYVIAEGGAQKYYDDNEWLGIEFIRAYRTLKDKTYLEKARLMFAFAVSGWSDTMEGGIFWRENDPETKNTCSNGPAALLAMLLFEETRDPYYLDWALKILEWVKRLKDPASGVYFDAVKSDGSIDERVFTYNTGTPLHANVLLYKATHQQAFLDEALALAEAGLRVFGKKQPDCATAILPNTPWFNAVWLRGLLELAEVDPARGQKYIQFFVDNLDHAWDHTRSADGTFTPDWTGKTEFDSGVRWLLDQAAMVELFAMLDRTATNA